MFKSKLQKQVDRLSHKNEDYKKAIKGLQKNIEDLKSQTNGASKELFETKKELIKLKKELRDQNSADLLFNAYQAVGIIKEEKESVGFEIDFQRRDSQLRRSRAKYGGAFL
tara:strand:- start:3747 stop:4079 length:333 start_codon:yes stop_codon:yes gene_type:complete